MSRLTDRRRLPRPDIAVSSGERLLAWAEVDGGHVGGTRDALYIATAPVEPRVLVEPDPSVLVEPVETTPHVEITRIPWEQVQAAEWNPESSSLRVSEVGTWGRPRPTYTLAVTEPGRLLELVRERVTASVLLQRYVPVSARLGIRVIARRAPRGDQPISWLVEYDEGLDPDDPVVRLAVEAALAAARDEVELF